MIFCIVLPLLLCNVSEVNKHFQISNTSFKNLDSTYPFLFSVESPQTDTWPRFHLQRKGHFQATLCFTSVHVHFKFWIEFEFK